MLFGSCIQHIFQLLKKLRFKVDSTTGKRHWVSHLIIGLLRICRDLIKTAKVSAASEGGYIDARAIIRLDSGVDFSIGNRVAIGAYTIIHAAGHDGAGGKICTRLSIGGGTYIGELSNLRAAGVFSIGSNCLIAQGVSIIGSNYDIASTGLLKESGWNLKKIGVTIADGVWIGANAIVLPGVSIGAGAVIAAGSVVTVSVAAGEVWGGVPAVCLKTRGINQ